MDLQRRSSAMDLQSRASAMDLQSRASAMDLQLIDYSYSNFNLFLPKPIQIDFAKRFSISILGNNDWLNFMNTHNNMLERVIYKKTQSGWTSEIITLYFNTSNYVFPVLDDSCKSETIYMIKPKIQKNISMKFLNNKQIVCLESFDEPIICSQENLNQYNKYINIETEERNAKISTILDLLKDL
jgi:hypothetical protein